MLLWIFQSTLPARGATEYVTRDELNTLTFQSTLPARGATRTIKKSCKNIWISIHAPRTGSDHAFRSLCARPCISIHAPRTGSDRVLLDACDPIHQFQSTLPARGATALQR